MACRFFAAGHCRHGSRCRFQHPTPPGEPDTHISRTTAAPSCNPETVSGPAPSASSTAATSAAAPPPAEPDRSECTLLSLALCDRDTQDFECCICFDLLADPRQCINGHPCCLACLTLHLQLSQTCPTCRIPMRLETAGRNLQLERQISALRFRCKNEGCPATFVRVERETHEQQCQYRLVECACRCRAAVHAFYAHLQKCVVWRDAGQLAGDLARAARRVADLEAELQRLQADLDSRLRDVDAAHQEREKERDEEWDKERRGFSAVLDGVLKELQKQPKSKGIALESKQQAIVSHIRNLKQSLEEAKEKAVTCEVASKRLTHQKEEERGKFSGMLKGIADSLRDIGFDMEDPWISDDLEDQVSYISAQIEQVVGSLKMFQFTLACREQALQHQTALAAAAKEELSRSVPKQRLEEEQAKYSATLGEIMDVCRPEDSQSSNAPACHRKDKKGYIMNQIQQLQQTITNTAEALQRQTAMVAAAKEELSRSVPRQRLADFLDHIMMPLGLYTPNQVTPPCFQDDEDKKRCIVMNILQLKQTITNTTEALQCERAAVATAKEELSRCVSKQRLAAEQAEFSEFLDNIMFILQEESPSSDYSNEKKKKRIVAEIILLQQDNERLDKLLCRRKTIMNGMREDFYAVKRELEEKQRDHADCCQHRQELQRDLKSSKHYCSTLEKKLEEVQGTIQRLQQTTQHQEKQMATMADEFDQRQKFFVGSVCALIGLLLFCCLSAFLR
eukprot:EG_transcript_4512